MWQNIETEINNEYDRFLLKGIFHLQSYRKHNNQNDLVQSVAFFKEALNSTDDLNRQLDLQKHVNKHFIKEELFEEAKEILSSL